MTDFIVQKAMRVARRGVLAMFLLAAAVLGCLLVERAMFQRTLEEAAAAEREAVRLADAVRRSAERRTTSAQLAAATGDQRSIMRFEANVAAMQHALRKARAAAPDAIASRFDEESGQASRRLLDLERDALALAGSGRHGRAILESPAYRAQQRLLNEGIVHLTRDLVAAERQPLARATAGGVAIIALLVLAGTAAFWRLLHRSLARSETLFVEAERRLQAQARRDPLTELANRRAYAEESARMVREAEGAPVAVISLDLDRFKPVNDLYGHAIGDASLQAIAGRLAAAVGPGAALARIGGDEFAASVPVEDAAGAAEIAQALLFALHAPLEIGELRVRVGGSIGVALHPRDGRNADTLRRASDLALKRAKKEGGSGVRFFRPELDDRLSRETARELRPAIADGQIVPFFQPVVDLRAGGLVGFEALARWIHPGRGTVSPGLFVPLAEELGLVSELTEAMLRAACRHALDWDGRLTVAVNVSPTQLADPWLADKILEVLGETGFPPGRLEIEITENAFIGDFETARRVVLALKERGVRIALDDFGSGYSSLAHLSELPFDKIKIDRSFVAAMSARPEGVTIVSTIVTLGQTLGIPTTAEGIETPEQAAALRALGCTFGQGFFYAEPLPAEAVPATIAHFAPRPARRAAS